MNYLITTGRLTKDAKLAFTAKGDPVLNFTVATDVGWGDSKHALFIDCALWGRRAESLDAYLKKGGQVTVRGEADLRQWEHEGKHGANITCKVDDVALQGDKRDTGETANPSDSGFRDKTTSAGYGTSNGFDDDSEIPF